MGCLACAATAETRPQYTLLSPPAYTNAWTGYLDLRRTQRPDVDFRLVNTADIYREHPFAAAALAGAPRNPAESIHAWIRAEMKTVTDPSERAQHYFVLGGSFVDAQTVTSVDDARLEKRVPGVFVRPRFAPDAVLRENEPYYSISDMFYACLDVKDGEWPWDANGNGKYADNQELANDRNDYRADVVVARIPVEKHPTASGAEVIAAFGAKVARAESPGFAGRYRFAAAGGQDSGRFDLSHEKTLRDEREFYDGGLNQFDPRHGGMWVDSEYVPRNTAKNVIAVRRPVLEGNPLFIYGYGADHASIEAAAAHYFSHDREYVEYRDHGSSEDLYCKYINNTAYLNATGLTRMIVSGFSCMTGYIDGEGLSLAEAELLSLGGGTVASVHNSRYGVSYTGKVFDEDAGLSPSLQYLIKRNVLDRDMDLGQAWLGSRQEYYARSEATGGTGRFVMLEQLLLGDPLIRLSPAVPETTCEGRTIAADRATGYTTLNVSGGTTIQGEGLFKVMTRLNVTTAGDLRFAANGGVGKDGVCFAAGNGKLTLASPTKGYFAQPTGAREVEIVGSGVTLDLGTTDPTFAALALGSESAARQTDNVLRGTRSGQLAGFVPLAIAKTEVALATSDAFAGAANGTLAIVTDGALGITVNPNLGLSDGLWEYFTSSVDLNGGTLFVDATKTAGFGRPEAPGLTVNVDGACSVETKRAGEVTLFGTTAFALADDATLTLAAAFRPDATTNGRLAIAGGETIVTDESGLVGEVSVSGGTLTLTKIPLLNVTRLTLTDGAKLVLPKDESGFYQILQPKGASLELNGAPIYTSDDLTTPVAGELTTTCAFFDKSAFLVWNTKGAGTWNVESSNTPWTLNGAAAAYTTGMKVYFPDVAMAVQGSVHTIDLTDEINCDYANFGNQDQKYRFTGARLNLKNLQVGTDVEFANAVYSSAGALVTGRTLTLADLNTPSLAIAKGATVSADVVGNDISAIRGLRFVPLDTAQSGGSRLSVSELQFNNKDGKIDLGRATVTEAPIEGVTSSGLAKAWDGSVDGFSIGMLGVGVWSVSFANSSVMAEGKYYLQFLFDSPIPMISAYYVGASYNNQGVESARSWRIEVTVDGESWVTVSRVDGVSYPGAGTGALWVNNGSAFTVSASDKTSVSVATGGAYVLTGAPKAKFAFEDGAILKAVPGAALQYAAGCTFAYPASGAVLVDASALDLVEGASQRILANAGQAFTFEDMAALAVTDGYYLSIDADGLSVVKGSPRPGPYTLAADGRVCWSEGDWGFDWTGTTVHPMADVEVVATNGLTLVIDTDVSFATFRQKDAASGDEFLAQGALRVEKADGVTVNALTYDLSAFGERVTVTFSTDAATVIAGKDTHLRENGTGRLVVGEGMKVTVYQPTWNGTIENNGGTVVFRGPLPPQEVLFR